ESVKFDRERGACCSGLRDGTFISWWPDENVDSNFRSGSFGVQTLEQDLQAEGSLPSVDQEISGLAEDVIHGWGVRVAYNGFAIPYTFENNPKTNHFDLWQTNCSNIVAIALRLGGCEKILPLPRFDMMTPIHIAAWARTAAAIQTIKAAFGR